MRKWEDALKERLEEYESPLSDDLYAMIQTRNEDRVPVPSKERFPLGWVISISFAAIMTCLIFIPKLTAPKEDLQIPLRESFEYEIPFSLSDVSQTAGHENKREPSKSAAISAYNHEKSTEESLMKRFRQKEIAVKEDNAKDIFLKRCIVEVPKDSILAFFPKRVKESRNTDNRISYPAAVVIGAGFGGSLLPGLPQLLSQGSSFSHSLNTDGLSSGRHFFPFRTGLSCRFYLSGQLSITTGLEYSLFYSYFPGPEPVTNKQVVQYLGFPLRLDWTLVSKKQMSVYVGSGLDYEECLAAVLDGYSIPKDGPRLSLICVGGVQYDLTDNVGFYVEPTFSWQFPPEYSFLKTYRSQNPFMFSVSTGIRFSIGRAQKPNRKTKNQ